MTRHSLNFSTALNAVVVTVILCFGGTSALRLSVPHWFNGKTTGPAAGQNPMLIPPQEQTGGAAHHPFSKPKQLPVTLHPHPHPPVAPKRGITNISSRGGNRPRQNSIRAKNRATVRAISAENYVCKTRSAGDLMERALERIGGSLFLTQERLDHFQGDNRFDPEFAAKYVPVNWEAFTQNRGVDRYPRCAVVGNSGHLTLSRYGRVINSFDAVIRTNQAPTKGYGHLVGHKTTFRLINRAMGRRYQDAMESRFRRLRKLKGTIETAANKYSRLKAKSKIRARLQAGDGTLTKLAENMALQRLGVTEDMLARLHQEKGVIKDLKSIMAGVGDSDVKVAAGRFPIEKNVTVILVAEASSTRQEMEQFIRAARAIRPDVKVVIQSGKTRKVVEDMLSIWTRRLKSCWGVDTTKGGKAVGERATTGILATVAMLRQCSNVTLYGFGPPLRGTGSAPFHFYDGLLSRDYKNASTDVHNFSAEFRLLQQLGEEGYLRICNERDSRLCGYSDPMVDEIKSQALRTGGSEDGPDEGEDAKDELDEDDEIPAEDEDIDDQTLLASRANHWPSTPVDGGPLEED
mmetsp:Transcript_32635/g.58426  ORF Transcript_32635/g.58426 Transcript_32635/m.58426 type:complete len:575 (+) Transcript_32635:340-2064(+)